ncbi:hypothetical protein D3C87_1985250 [compost metagenome]
MGRAVAMTSRKTLLEAGGPAPKKALEFATSGREGTMRPLSVKAEMLFLLAR